MKTIESDVIIIGGGLTGLMLAYLLNKKKTAITIVEARGELGGRILTKYEHENAPLEMGATWLGKQHAQLMDLLSELELGVFDQELGNKAFYEPISTSPPQLVTLPHNSDPSFRIRGGSFALIKGLATRLEESRMYKNQPVKTITQEEGFLALTSDDYLFKAPLVVSTLPPYLLTQTIKINPALPDAFVKIAAQTHTWMGESIKVGLTYEKPFWRSENSSGTIVSNVGPIPEMYDHSNYEDSFYALKGFLNGVYFSLTKAQRLQLIITQLRKYFGDQVKNYRSYEELIWRNEPFTYKPYQSHVLPHQNNGNPIYRQPYLNGKLFIAGSETSANFPGYMEGAVQSAQYIYQQLEGWLK